MCEPKTPGSSPSRAGRSEAVQRALRTQQRPPSPAEPPRLSPEWRLCPRSGRSIAKAVGTEQTLEVTTHRWEDRTCLEEKNQS